ALLWFDYLLTLGREINFIWPLRLSTSALLYHTVRYPALLTAIILCFNLAIERLSSTNAISVFSALRIYAVTDRSRPTLVVVLVISLIAPGIWTVR
ncbi:hypothetical protein C8Q76DRAFT_582091, partial [Earliella scabrosa]